MSIAFPELAAIRLGYGLSPVLPPPATPAEVLAEAEAVAAQPPVYTTAEAQQAQVEYNRLDKARRKDRKDGAAADAGDGEAERTPAQKQFIAYRQELSGRRNAYLTTRVIQCATARAGFGDRLIQFWADHFTTRAGGAGLHPMSVAFVEEAIRPHIFGPFERLLAAAETHPAMVIFLDQNRSVGPTSRAARSARRRQLGLNENLAREVLELHTLGVSSGYTQADVRGLAALLTGLGYAPEEEVRFFPRRAEPGADVVLGRSYGGSGPGSMDDILAVFGDLARHPDTATHIAGKLAVHFVSDEPEEALVADLAAAWRESGGDLPRVYAVLVEHPALARQFRQKVRQPFDFLAASLRALGLQADMAADLPPRRLRRALLDPIRAMGQPWFGASGPDGWPEAGEAWIRPQLLAERIDWAMNVPIRLVDPLPDPRGFLETALGGTAGEALVWAVPKAESIREGVGVVLASSDFNRR